MEKLTLPRGGTLALIGGLWGLIAALGLAGLRAVMGAIGGDPLPWALPGDLVFAAILVMPYALTLAALRWGGPALRAATWAAGAVLSILAIYTTFSGLGFAFVPAAPILLAASIRTGRGMSLRRAALGVGLAVLLTAANVGAFRALFIQPDGMCWHLIREADGVAHWEPAPYSETGTIDVSNPGIVETRCSSDVFSVTELLSSAGLLALAVAAWVGVRRMSPTAASPAAG